MKKTGRPPKLDAATVAADIVANRGNITAVARKSGVTRQAVQNFVNRKPKLRRILHDAREGLLDEVESALYAAAMEGQPWAVCFFLKTQARHRGYCERPQDLPPLRVLLDTLPPDVSEVVREALLAAIQQGK